MEGHNKRLWVHLDLEPPEEAILGESINLQKTIQFLACSSLI